MSGRQKRQHPVAGERTGRSGSRNDSALNDTARCSRESTARILIKLSSPPVLYVIAADADEERAAQAVALSLIEVLERGAAA